MQTPVPHTPVSGKSAYERVLDALLRTLVRLRLVDPVVKDVAPVFATGRNREGAVVLPFPVRGEALLVNLASALRERVRFAETVDDPLLATISRGRRPRLSLDRDAYVEFNTEDATFHLKIDASPALKLTLETREFATLVEFVAQYCIERQGDRRQVEDAS
ncbi:hypothetical protein AC629_18685 [Bradyrhizobium sp. NAS80.1]|nr:hypothetical protein AC629_18685 [Bradyrhizobium sp. NAS80.1]